MQKRSFPISTTVIKHFPFYVTLCSEKHTLYSFSFIYFIYYSPRGVNIKKGIQTRSHLDFRANHPLTSFQSFHELSFFSL